MVHTNHLNVGHGTAQEENTTIRSTTSWSNDAFQSSVYLAKTKNFPEADTGRDHELVMMTFRLPTPENETAGQRKNQVQS